MLSPSAFIPFCDFGGNMSAMGVKIENFSVPVCNSFQAKIYNDQLCYEVDLNRFSDKYNIDKELKSGFTFLMDYNEDRQTAFKSSKKEITIGLASSITEEDHSEQAQIYLNTIGWCCNIVLDEQS